MEALFPDLNVARLGIDKEPKTIEANEIAMAKDAPIEVVAEDPPLAPVVIIFGEPSSLALRARIPLEA